MLRRIVTLIFLALGLTPTWAQTSIPGFPPGVLQSRGALDAAPAGGCSQATTFLARTSGLNGTHTTAYTNLICGLVTDGLWTKLDALYILATQDSTTSLLNLVSTSFGLTAIASPTFTADQGYAGNGSTQYLKTGFIPSSAGGQMTLNSASISAYDRTSRTSDLNCDTIGAVNAAITSFIQLLPRQSTSIFAGYANNVTAMSVTNTQAQGMYVVTRTAVQAGAGYRNGSSIVTDVSNPSVALVDAEIYVLARNLGGSPSQLCTDQLAEAHIGSGFSSTDAANFTTRVNAYMTAVGANVF